MFSSHKSRGKQQSAPANTSQFALAAARAIVPPRSQTPTLSAAAAAAALHASPKVVTSPGEVVTRRIARRGSVASSTGAPPHDTLVRRGSDSSMTERIGWLRDREDVPGGRPGSRSSNRPPSRDVKSPTRGLESRHAPAPLPAPAKTSKATMTSAKTKKTTKPLESRHAVRSQEYDEEVEEEEVPRQVVSKPRKAAAKPKAAPVQPKVESAPVVAAARAAQPKAKAKPKPKPQPKPVEPVYASSSEEEEEEEEEQQPQRRRHRYQDEEDEEDSEEEVERQPQSSFHMKSTLRSTPVEAAPRVSTKKKNDHAQTHSDTQGSMLSRGTMRTTVRDDMQPVIQETKQRQRSVKKPAPTPKESSHAPAPYQEPARDENGPSDEVKALALAIMRSQQKQAAKKPVIAPSKRAQRRKQAAALPPDTAEDDDNFGAGNEEQDAEKAPYKRSSYAGSASSVGSFASDLESIPEEAANGDIKGTGLKKKKRRSVRESVIIPGKDGVPALPHSPILEKERNRLAKVQSPEPSEGRADERKRTLEKLTGDSPISPKPANVHLGRDVEDSKISPPSSATLTEEPFQPVIQTIPPTPPATSDKPIDTRFLGSDDSGEDAKSPKTEDKPRQKSSPSLEASSLRPLRRHSPPPRSLSPAKSALKHSHHDGSDRSSIMSAEDTGSVGGSVSGRRKYVRVSFSEDPAVVEMDDDQYHYKPIHSSTLDKISSPKSPSKGISGVSFSSISRTRVEHTPSPEPPQETSSDSRIGGLIGSEFFGKLKTKVGKNKDTASPVSPTPISPHTIPPSTKESQATVLAPGKGTAPSHELAPEIVSVSPPPSISDDDELEEEPRKSSPGALEAEKTKPIVPSPLQTVSIAEQTIPEEPKGAQIAAGSTPPAVELKPIFPPTTSDLTGNTATLPQNIGRGRSRSLDTIKDGSDDDEHFSDAYEDLNHVVVSATGSGAVLGVTTMHKTPEVVNAGDNVVLPSIAEVVTEQPLDEAHISIPPKSLAPAIAGGPLPEEVISDEREEEQKSIVSPKPINPVSPKLISEQLQPAPQPVEEESIEPVALSKTIVSKIGSLPTKATAQKSPLSESRHAPKPQESEKKAKATAAQPVTGGKLKKQKQKQHAPAPAPVPAPVPQRTLSVSSDDSESSFQRENPHRKEARKSQGKGFSMRTSMRDSTGAVPPSAMRDTGLSTSKWADSSPPRFESGFRTGRTIGTGGPRRREYSPDSSDDDARKVVKPKAERKSGFLGKATLRGSGSRPSSSQAPAPKPTGKGKGVLGFRSRFEDSSDEEDDVETSSYMPTAAPAQTYRPLTPDSSDDEDVHQPTSAPPSKAKQSETDSGVFLGKGTLRDSKHAPFAGSAPENGFTTTISSDAETTPKKKWWSFGSKRGGSRPPSRAGSTIMPPPTTPKPTLDRRISDPTTFSSPPAPRPSIKKYRKNSSGSVTSIGSAQTWTPMSLGTSTLMSGSPSGNRTLTHRLSGLEEVEEDDMDTSKQQPAETKAQTTEPNGDIYGTTKSQKKKKFPKLRRMFGIED